MEHLRVWVKELNFFWNNTWHKELDFLWNEIWPKELNLLFYITQRIEFFWRKELNPFSRIGLKELNLFYLSQRLENLLLNMTQWFEPLFYMTQRIEPFLEFDSMDWTLFCKSAGDSKYWTFSGMCLKQLSFFFFWTWLEELTSCLHD